MQRLQYRVVRNVRRFVTLLQQVSRATAVAEDAEEPGIKALPLLVARQSAIQSHERVLNDVVRIGGVAEHALGEAHAPGIVPLDDHLERLDIAQLRAIDECRIDGWPGGFAIGQRADGRRGSHSVTEKLNLIDGEGVTQACLKSANRVNSGYRVNSENRLGSVMYERRL